MRKTRATQNLAPVEIDITGLTHEGKGVGRVDGKAVFVDGALPGEQVVARVLKRHRNFDEAEPIKLLKTSPARVTALCAHFGVCGGCVLQHMESHAQLQFKQQLLIDNLMHIGAMEPQRIMQPLHAQAWGYRRKARLGVKYVEKKGRVLIGFRERRSHFLADVTRCPVLHPVIGDRLVELADVIGQLDIRNQIPQVEVAVGDEGQAMIFRHLSALNAHDTSILTEFGKRTEFMILAQPAGPDELNVLYAGSGQLRYSLPAYDLAFEFGANEFTQINHDINRQMVDQAIQWLALTDQDRVLDLFCGLGNFSLPIARRAGHVIGIEGEIRAIARARANAQLNGIENAIFHVQNLAEDFCGTPWMQQRYSKLLLDPPRTGALETLQFLHRVRCHFDRLVYVSCNPSTLARDARYLTETMGYTLAQAGAMDMFPQTAHVESMALFVRKD